MDLKGLDDFTNSWWPIVISFLISVVAAIRLYAGGRKCPNDDRMNGKVVVITGGSSGIGLSVAKELTSRGAQVIIACRNEEKGQEAIKDIKRTNKGAKVETRSLDVSRLGSIKEFVVKISMDYGKIDVLINNAGIIFNQHHLTEENLELTFVTNYLGPFLLSHLLLPLLEGSRSGRIINIGATAHKLTTITLDNFDFSHEFIYRSAFGQTKLALVLFTKHMGTLLKAACKNITINAVNPGLVRGTNHLKQSPLGNSWMTRVSVLPWTWLFLKSPKQGAQSVIYVATDRKFERTTGEYISECEIDDGQHDKVNDKHFMGQLYQKSCDLCGIKPFTE